MIRAVALALFWVFLAGPVAAWDTTVDRPSGGGFIHDVKIGALAHDVPYLWSGFNKEPYSVDLNIEIMFGPSVSFMWGTIRPALGATVNFGGYTSKAYLDARWQLECCWGAFFALGLGLAIHNGDVESLVWNPVDKQLGRRVLFHPSVEWGYRLNDHNSLSLFFEHISNASTAPKNQGLDTLGVRYGYRF